VITTDAAPGGDQRIVADNLEVIASLGGVEVLGRIPWSEELETAKRWFAPVGERFLSALEGFPRQ